MTKAGCTLHGKWSKLLFLSDEPCYVILSPTESPAQAQFQRLPLHLFATLIVWERWNLESQITHRLFAPTNCLFLQEVN